MGVRSCCSWLCYAQAEGRNGLRSLSWGAYHCSLLTLKGQV